MMMDSAALRVDVQPIRHSCAQAAGERLNTYRLCAFTIASVQLFRQSE